MLSRPVHIYLFFVLKHFQAEKIEETWGWNDQPFPPDISVNCAPTTLMIGALNSLTEFIFKF